VTTTSRFNMLTSIKDSADETSLDGGRGQTYHHTRKFTEKSRIGRVKVYFTVIIKGDVEY
jgi:hypothetical protein